MAGPIIYSNAGIYIESATSKVERLNKVEEIIDALYATALKAAAGENISEYFLNDGQVQIKTEYRTAADVQKSIKEFEVIKQMLLNQLNRRVIRLTDSRNFI